MAKSKKFEVEAALRQEKGKSASRRLRRNEKTPAVVYGGGEPPVSLTLEHHKISRALEDEAFYSRILTLKTDANSERVILKDLQRHPYKPRILHVDFQRVRADEKLHMHVPLHFVGAEKSPGVKEGGIVSHIMNDVEVACFPDQLPEYIEIDISGLQINQTLHLSDMAAPSGVEIVALTQGNDQPMVSIHLPRVEVEPAPGAEETPLPAEVPATAQKSEAEGQKEEKK